MNVPYSRLEAQQGGLVGLGRTTEVTRDELKFNKFITKIRNKFSKIFDEALEIQLVLKGICTREEWHEFKDSIYFEYKKDNNFTELRDAELWQNRLQLLGQVDPFVGRYFSQEWVKKNVLQLTDDDIKEMQKQMDSEPQPEQVDANGMPVAQEGAEQQQESQPIDNTYEKESVESDTPELDSVVRRFSRVINTR